MDVKKQHYDLGVLLDEEMKRKIISNAFKECNGYIPDLDNPTSFNEKIQWLKLYYQNPLITRCADKYAVKRYVLEKTGEDYSVPTIAVWNNPNQIDFDALPDQFVLKVNWSSGYNIIVQDKAKLNIEKTREQLRIWMEPCHNSYYHMFNWGFKHMKPVVYAEKYLEQANVGRVIDYKYHICNGKFEYLLVVMDRDTEKASFTWFDKEFCVLPFNRSNNRPAEVPPSKPVHYDEMVAIAEKLAEPFPFVRVDFYEVEDKMYLGEMTFYSGSGLIPFSPRRWDYILGEKIVLPEKLITDVEPKYLLRKKVKQAVITVRTISAQIRRKIIHRENIDGRNFLVVFGVRMAGRDG